MGIEFCTVDIIMHLEATHWILFGTNTVKDSSVQYVDAYGLRDLVSLVVSRFFFFVVSFE